MLCRKWVTRLFGLTLLPFGGIKSTTAESETNRMNWIFNSKTNSHKCHYLWIKNLWLLMMMIIITTMVMSSLIGRVDKWAHCHRHLVLNEVRFLATSCVCRSPHSIYGFIDLWVCRFVKGHCWPIVNYWVLVKAKPIWRTKASPTPTESIDFSCGQSSESEQRLY